MNHNKLPADSNAMTLGIIAIVIVFLGCCCGLFSITSLVLSIIGLTMANKSLREYKEYPDSYSPNSYTNVNNAKILNLIALLISAILTLCYLVYFFFYGAIISTALLEGYKNSNNDYNYEMENDSLYYDDDYIIEIESDSIHIDSIPMEKMNKLNNSEE